MRLKHRVDRMMGAGKTAIGGELARRLGRPFADTDVEIERAATMTIPEIFARDGEEFFRARRSEVLGRVLALGDSIISTRGGAWLRPETASASRRTASRSGWTAISKRSGCVASARHGPLCRRPTRAARWNACWPNARRLCAGRYPRHPPPRRHVYRADGRIASSPPSTPRPRHMETHDHRYRPCVDLGERSYDVLIGAGLLARRAEIVRAGRQARVAI